ncbi:MAG: HlyD family efflux transporter periplasmic adaptor subunit [Betaproteobacteria bacterium]|nr:HlyD family efflux transporter periplasmic adaptor subunit [Betaproteobacteria bacterium]
MTPTTPLTLHQRIAKNGGRWIVYAAIGIVVLIAVWLMLKPEAIVTEISPVVVGPMEVTIDNQGQLRVHDKYVIAAPVAAELERIELHDGDAVRKGQRVAVLRVLPLDARQREEAIARLDAARALSRAATLSVQKAASDQKLAASELARMEKLVTQGFMSPQAVERARNADVNGRAELRAAKAREEAAQADVKTAQAALPPAGAANDRRTLELVANVDGQILRIHEKSARTVAAGTPLITIGDPARFEVIVDVLSADAVKIRPGAEMRLEQWGGGKTLRAKVRTVEPEAFTKVSALGIEEQRVNIIGDPIDPLGERGTMGDGYRAEVRIVVWSSADATIIPGSSLFRVGEQWRVFTVEEGQARERTVAVGQRNATHVQVLEGVKAGEQVIRFPGNTLSEGVRVEPRAGKEN